MYNLLIVIISMFPTSQKQNIPNHKLADITKEFLIAKERSYQQYATAEDVVKFLSYCGDSVVYDHILTPAKKFSFTGKDIWKRGAISHLGETRNVKIRVLNIITRQNVVIAEFSMYRETRSKDGWKKEMGKNVSIMEFDDAKKIQKITDYL
ncbi:MAG: hypothetical protein JWN76_458 [Chitinophagaceae bacterium]|nr:hypothetical protein [Chitinophagaceae bacterium]